MLSGKAPRLVSVNTALLLLLIIYGALATLNVTLSKLCGTYRSYPYVGIACQHPNNSPSMGLLWYQPSRVSASRSSLSSLLRHEANHDDHLQRFGWNHHDGAGYGRQELVDPQNHVNLTFQWVHLDNDLRKSDDNSTISWVLRVTGESLLENAASTDLSLMWYMGTPGDSTARYDPWSGIIQGRNHQTCIVPYSDTNFSSYHDSQSNSSKMYNATYFAAFQVPISNFFDPKPTVLQELRNPTSSLPPHLFDPSSLYRAETALVGNQIVQQLFLTTPFQVDVHLNLLLHSSNSGKVQNVSKCHSSWRTPQRLLSLPDADFNGVLKISSSPIITANHITQTKMSCLLFLVPACPHRNGPGTRSKLRSMHWATCSAASPTCMERPKSMTMSREV